MTAQRRIVRHRLPVTDEATLIPDGTIVAAAAFRNYPEDLMATHLDLWIETVVHLDAEGEPRELRDLQVVVVGTDRPVPDGASWIRSVVDGSAAWHIYRTPRTGPTLGELAEAAVAVQAAAVRRSAQRLDQAVVEAITEAAAREEGR